MLFGYRMDFSHPFLYAKWAQAAVFRVGCSALSQKSVLSAHPYNDGQMRTFGKMLRPL